MDYENLSNKIKSEMEKIGKSFIDFQTSSPYKCPPGCGNCCLNPDVACSPYELLPLALSLLKRGLAEEFLDRAKNEQFGFCILTSVTNLELGMARCSEYEYRPLICRAFGVAGRKNKKDEIDLSICKTLKDIYPDKEFIYKEENVPLIGSATGMLQSIDPVFFEEQKNINTSLIYILEKVLIWNSYQS